jgi:hypothetical protein
MESVVAVGVMKSASAPTFASRGERELNFSKGTVSKLFLSLLSF